MIWQRLRDWLTARDGRPEEDSGSGEPYLDAFATSVQHRCGLVLQFGTMTSKYRALAAGSVQAPGWHHMQPARGAPMQRLRVAVTLGFRNAYASGIREGGSEALQSQLVRVGSWRHGEPRGNERYYAETPAGHGESGWMGHLAGPSAG